MTNEPQREPGDVEALAEHWHWDDDEVGAFRCGYVERREPCPIPERLYVFTPSELATDRARVRAETLTEAHDEIHRLNPPEYLDAPQYREGLIDGYRMAAAVVRGMAEAGEPDA